MKVSVIITAYNTPAEKLNRAIKSVLAQSYKDYEIILVNDGGDSFDTSFELGDSKVNKIRYFEHDKNYGGAKALNTGVREAKGDYIAILDSDDYFTDPDKLKKQAEFLDNNYPFVGAVGTGATVIMKKGDEEKIVKVRPRLDPFSIQAHILDTSPICHSGCMYRKSAWKSVGGYDETLKRGKDWDFFLKVSRRCQLANIPDDTITFEDVWIPAKRYEDAKASLKILWKYRDYGISVYPLEIIVTSPRFWRPFVEAIVRYVYYFLKTI